MSEPASELRVPYEEYLRQERQELEKHEWIDGEVFAMVGGTPKHARLQGRLIRLIGNALEGHPYEVYTSDLRIRSRVTAIATYADVTVICGPLETDRGQKAAHYRQIPAIREYVLVDQTTAHVEVFRRGGAGWEFHEAGPGEHLTLESVCCTIDIDRL